MTRATTPYDIMRALRPAIGTTIAHPFGTDPEPWTLSEVLATDRGVTLCIAREGQRPEVVRLDIHSSDA